MGADKYPKCPQIDLPKLSVQAQKFGIFYEKKASLGVRSPCMRPYLTLSEKEDCTY